MARTWWGCVKAPKSRSARPAARRPSRTPRPLVELLEERCLLSVEFRPIDEFGNNVANPNLGMAGTDLLRLSPAAYRPNGVNNGDGLNTPSMTYGAPTFVAGPRLVSNTVSNQATVLFGSTDVNTVNGNGLSDFGYTWGQFLDHDMDITPDQTGFPVPPAPNNNKDGNLGFPIPVDPGHDGIATPGVPQPEVLDPIGSLAFSRSQFNPDTGITTPRQQFNANTSFLDLSQVYGSTQFVSDALRVVNPDSSLGYLLKTSPGNRLPFNNTFYFTAPQLVALNMANANPFVSSTDLFAAGDVRANETIELTSLHTLFMRNHNAIATQLKAAHTDWTDQQVFDEARMLNIAEEQIITYTAYLPALLGPTAIPAFTVYNPGVNPSISTEFSTVGFRFGHSLLNNTVARDANDGSSVGDIGLAISFFNPTLLTPGGVDFFGNSATDIGAVLKGDADNNAQAMDVMAVSSIRNLLFGQGGPGEDLIARDLWRADDHGIGTYNQVRFARGLPLITDTLLTVTDPTDGFTFVSHGFEQITSDVHVQRLLSDAFTGPTRATFLANGKFAGDINPFIAGLAEDHVPASDMGPLFHNILVDQFTRLRDGDRFFYLNEEFTAEESAILGQGDTLAEVIKANTGITNVQDDVFIQVSISGTVFDDRDRDGVRDPDEPGVAGKSVRLTDLANGQRVTVTTGADGSYRFDVFNGLRQGDFEVRLLIPDGQATSPNKVNVSVGRGVAHVQVDFGFRAPGGGGGGGSFLAGDTGGTLTAATFDGTSGGTGTTDGSTAASAPGSAAVPGSAFDGNFLAAASATLSLGGTPAALALADPAPAAPQGPAPAGSSSISVSVPPSTAGTTQLTLALPASGKTVSASTDLLGPGEDQPLPADPFAGDAVL